MSSPTPHTAIDTAARKRILSGFALLTLAVLMWAGNAIVGRLSAGEDIPPMGLNFWRWVTAFALFTLIFGRQTWALRSELLRHWKFLAGFACVSIVGFNTTFYIALQSTTALQATLIQSVLPVLVLMLGLTILREQITPRQAIGVVFSMAGAVVIVIRGDPAVFKTLALQEGDIWALISVSLWACQAFLMRWKPASIPIMPFMNTITGIGIIVMLPLYLWETSTGAAMPFSEASITSVLYVGVMAGFVGTTCWNEGTYRAGGTQAGYFGNLYPIFAGLLAILILGEDPHWYHGAGAASVLIGIWLATAQHTRTPAKN